MRKELNYKTKLFPVVAADKSTQDREATDLDHSVMELFANDEVCLTGRPYTRNLEAIHIGIIESGGSAEKSRLKPGIRKVSSEP